jgi:hypothetical protein
VLLLTASEHPQHLTKREHACESATFHHHKGPDVMLGHHDHSIGQHGGRTDCEQRGALYLENFADLHGCLRCAEPSMLSVQRRTDKARAAHEHCKKRPMPAC